MDEEELKEIYVDAKKEAIQHFQKKAVGTIADEYNKELKTKMTTLFHQIKDENERESVHASHMFLGEAYTFIERRLKNKEFTGFHEYEKDMLAF
jgi:hypothetical protein